MKPATELATRIGRALIPPSNRHAPTWTWSPFLEQTLHQLGCRHSLTPSLVASVIDSFLYTHHSLALGFFNWASQQPGYSHDSRSYGSVLKSLSLSRQFSSMDALLKQVKLQSISLDPSVCRLLIGSMIRGRKPQNAFWVFNESRSLTAEIGEEVCNSLLAVLASGGYIDNARKVFDEMIRRGVSLSTVGFGVFIWKFCRNAQKDEILGVLDEAKNSDCEINGSIIGLLIVHGLCHASREMEALSLLDELRSRDCKPDFMAYRIVAESFRSTGSMFETEMVLKKKRKLGVSPRANDYKHFILGLISEGMIHEAKEISEVIVNGNFPIEDMLLDALIGSISAIDHISAIKFLRSLIEKGKLPTLLTLSNLSKNLCKNDKTEELLEVYQLLSVNEYFSDSECYNVMVSFLCKAGKVREAYDVLQEMKKKGLGPDVEFYNCLMEACCREDLIRPAKRLWDEMFASGCTGNLKTYNILISKLLQVGELEEALHLFHHMMDRGIPPNVMIYSSLIQGLCQESKFESAFELFNKFVGHDGTLAQSVLSMFVLQLCQNGQYLLASKLLCDSNRDLVDPESHVVLLKFLANAKEIESAVKHVKWIQEMSPSVLQAILAKLVASLASSPEPESIIKLLLVLQEKYPECKNDAWKDLYALYSSTC